MPRPSEIAWFSFFVECLLKSTLLLSLALCLAYLLRKKSASLRHFVLAFFLVGLILFPAVSTLSPGWETRWLPPWASGRRPPACPAADKIPDSQPAYPRNETAAAPPGAAIAAEAPRRNAGESGSRADSGAGAALMNSVSGRGLGLPAGRLTAVVWLAGFCVLLARLFAGLIGASRLSREAEPLADAFWRDLLERLLILTRLRKKIDLKSHAGLAVPVTCGFFQPVIIMPEASLGWPEKQRRSALVHELSHIRRADFPIMILVRLSLAAFWFNPLSWIVFRELKKEQEKACDEMVLEAGIKPSAYAADLLMLKRAAGAPRSVSPELLGLFGRSRFDDRLAAILRSKSTFKEIRMKNKIILCVSILAFAAFIGTAHPSAAAPKADAAVVDAEYAPAGAEIRSGNEAQAGVTEKQARKKEEKAEGQEEADREAKKVKVVTVKKAEAGERPVEIIIRKPAGAKVVVLEESDLAEIEGVEKDLVSDKAETDVVIKTIREPRPAAGKDGWTVLEDEEEGEHVIVRKRTAPRLAVVRERTLELQGKLKAVESELEKIKALKPDMRDALKDLEKSLKELGEELAAGPGKMTGFDITAGEHPAHTMIIRKKVVKGGGTGPGFEEAARSGERLEEIEEPERPAGVEGREAYAFAFKFPEGEMNRTAYEKAMEKVKETVPEGCKLDSSFDEKTGEIKVKITGPDSGCPGKIDVDKLLETLKHELKIKTSAGLTIIKKKS